MQAAKQTRATAMAFVLLLVTAALLHAAAGGGPQQQQRSKQASAVALKPCTVFRDVDARDILGMYAESRRGLGHAVLQVGANDGNFSASNDVVQRHIASGAWRGLLVEPIPWLVDRLREVGKGWVGPTQVVQGALCEPGKNLSLWATNPKYAEMYPNRPHWQKYELANTDRNKVVHTAALCGRKRVHRKRGAKLVEFETTFCDTSLVDRVDVPCHSAASLLNHEHIRGVPLDALIVDAEGADSMIVSAFLEAGARPPLITMESKPRGQLEADLLEYGYDWWMCNKSLFGDAVIVKKEGVCGAERCDRGPQQCNCNDPSKTPRLGGKRKLIRERTGGGRRVVTRIASTSVGHQRQQQQQQQQQQQHSRQASAAALKPCPAFRDANSREVLSMYAESRRGLGHAVLQVGANDGNFSASNDVVQRHIASGAWRGLLVEPIPWLVDRLLAARKGWAGPTQVVQGAVCEPGGNLSLWTTNSKYAEMYPNRPHWQKYELASTDKSKVIRAAELCGRKRVFQKRGGRVVESDRKFCDASLLDRVDVPCHSAASLLNHEHIRGVPLDALIVDAEGEDSVIVSQFLEAGARPPLITMESKPQERLETELLKHGYDWWRCNEALFGDYVVVRMEGVCGAGQKGRLCNCHNATKAPG